MNHETLTYTVNVYTFMTMGHISPHIVICERKQNIEQYCMTRRKQNGCHDPNLEQYRAQPMMYTNTKICLLQEKQNSDCLGN